MLGTELRARLEQIEQQMRALADRNASATRRSEDHRLPSPHLSQRNHCRDLQFDMSRPTLSSCPLRLTEVCKPWRELAHSTCQLWTCLRSAHILPAWLPRTGGLPLQIKVTFTEEDDPALLQMLSQHSSQWETLELVWRNPDACPIDLSGLFPILKRLGYSGRTDLPTFPTSFDAPQLRDLQLGFVHDTDRWHDPSVCMRLTKVELNCLLPGVSLQFLAQTPNVQELFIRSLSRTFPPNAPTPLLLHHLHNLQIRGESDMLAYLTLPALKSLSFSLKNNDWEGTADRLSQLVARSRCTLRQLELVDSHELARYQFLQLVSVDTIRYLTLTDPHGSLAYLFEVMSGNHNPMFPALESLRIDRYNFGSSLEPLAAMLMAGPRVPMRSGSWSRSSFRSPRAFMTRNPTRSLHESISTHLLVDCGNWKSGRWNISSLRSSGRPSMT
ncbi:hypothetical protein FB45DRAFT_898005, partial [Roridomyces roridus]